MTAPTPATLGKVRVTGPVPEDVPASNDQMRKSLLVKSPLSGDQLQPLHTLATSPVVVANEPATVFPPVEVAVNAVGIVAPSTPSAGLQITASLAPRANGVVA